MEDLPLFDAARSRAARDEALSRVSANAGSFMEQALAELRKLAREGGDSFTGEDVRRILSGKGIVPHSPNAWGALIRCATLEGLMVMTGRYVPMKDVRSHSRRTAEYRWVKER